MIKTLLALSLLAASTSALAQTPTTTEEPKVEVRYQARSVVDFTNAYINGELERPEGIIYKVPKKPRFRNLIELRSNFRPELSTSPGKL